MAGADLAETAVEQLKLDIVRTARRLRDWLRSRLGSGETIDRGAAADVTRDLAIMLGQLGFNDAALAVVNAFEGVANMTVADVGGPTIVGLDDLKPFVGTVASKLIAVKASAAEAARTVLMDLVARGAPPDAASIQAIVDAAESTLTRVVTAIDTSLFAFHRFALLEQAEESGVDLFEYSGPDDAVIRPFCERHVDKVYTRGDLDREDNGQGLEPTSAFLGGYNCRHRLAPVRREDVELADCGGPEARMIVAGVKLPPNEIAFISKNRGKVVDGKVVRRR
jgi:hypothetical protein